MIGDDSDSVVSLFGSHFVISAKANISSSRRKLPNFVIPAKAGIQLLPLSLLSIFSVPR